MFEQNITHRQALYLSLYCNKKLSVSLVSMYQVMTLCTKNTGEDYQKLLQNGTIRIKKKFKKNRFENNCLCYKR